MSKTFEFEAKIKKIDDDRIILVSDHPLYDYNNVRTWRNYKTVMIPKELFQLLDLETIQFIIKHGRDKLIGIDCAAVAKHSRKMKRIRGKWENIYELDVLSITLKHNPEDLL